MERHARMRHTRICWCLVLMAGLNGCQSHSKSVDEAPADYSTQDVDTEFGIFWPPWVLGRSLSPSDSPLLRGNLAVQIEPDGETNVLRMHVTLTRPEGKSDRRRWNKSLAFPQHSWMEAVRVWDAEREWLWPNLPYLLRAHGEERVERYGGVDPGKQIDNDFAGVLIQSIDAPGAQPLVSAEWYPGVAGDYDTNSIVHVAKSDDFRFELIGLKADSGQIGFWLIYADFLGARAPKSWPSEPEFNGGILAYLEVSWTRTSDGTLGVDVQHLPPSNATGFDWEQWSTGPSALKKNLGK